MLHEEGLKQNKNKIESSWLIVKSYPETAVLSFKNSGVQTLGKVYILYTPTLNPQVQQK